MSRLRELQEQFQHYVHEQQAGIQEKIIDAPQLSIHDRVEIYRKGYYLRLIEILQREFSALHNLIGKDAFEALARDYINAYPSTHFSVKAFGRYMPKFLAKQAEPNPLHIELAEFEWEFGKVIDGPDGPQLTVEDMGKIPPEAWAELRLTLHPSCRFVCLEYNTPAVWQALFENNPEKYPVPAVVKAEHPKTWLVWRFNQQAHYDLATPAELKMISTIQANQTFPEICESLCELMDPEQVPQFAGETLRKWVSLGLISEAKISA